MTKNQIISHIRAYATEGVLKTANSEALQRRIQALADIEYAAQEAREQLEASLIEREEQGTQPC